MSIEIETLTPDDGPWLADTLDYAFVADPTRPARAHLLEQVDWRRAFGATRDGQRAGCFLLLDLQLAVPGPLGTVRSHHLDGVSWVVVSPDHRRQGVLGAMMRHHLEQARERGVAWSGLHASETGIYGRFGYAVAALDVRYRIPTGITLAAPPAVQALAEDVEVCTLYDLDRDDVAARLRSVSRGCADAVLGTITWPEAKERSVLRDSPEGRRGKEPLRALIATRDGVGVGFARYTRALTWANEQPDGELSVCLVAADPGALLALARRLLAEDLMRTVDIGERGLDDPLLWWAGGPRAVQARVLDGLWLRPVDIGPALGSRGYSAPCDLVLDVADDTCPWNTGTWRLRVGADGHGHCERAADASPDARVAVQALGATYLGLRGWGALAASGDVEELTPGTLNALTAAFAAGSAPLGGLMF
ncbi:GNAT superfamily N-acetyltransferase [Kineosphaera limosa]|uniref:N-acetyltransferase domain-containing protein n=1 Tax=Kineosphaera limosa NBRC 100340 TaxID=1184609 RepID=K6WBQ6_9MICO|nr:GNAT family N-acetyltransferase [Kineosphaera limosa]NYE01513.1 GNAT superfamily N-acetyltransferase [Kineosphaera limosa]GAB96670.1 hypothetical protein KILIM_045_00010 [Kineosphaera limosa NBRC 100340]